VHNAEKALQSISDAQDSGFHELTLDLIYGIPGQTDEVWRNNLETAADLGVSHFSAYSLTVERRTALEKMIETGKSQPVDEDQTARHFMLMHEWAEQKKFIPYEISNFAREGHIARHNSGYWKGMPYAGFGPSAHSYNGNSRQWNIANNANYIKNIQAGLSYYETEELTAEQHFQEYIMTGMRTIEGCDLQEIQNRFGKEKADLVIKNIQKFISAGNAEMSAEKIRITIRGRLIADHIIREIV
jgi:oxygen-independent coproporphyrinogen-3 oxidase